MTDDGAGGPREPTEHELDRMSNDERATLGSRLDGVEVVDESGSAPPGSAAERRARRLVGVLLGVSTVAAIAFVVAFVAWPWHYDPAVDPFRGSASTYYTPILGITFGVSVLALMAALLLNSKALLPDDLAVQQRHDGPSSSVTQQSTAGRLAELGDQVGIGRRSLLVRVLVVGGSALGAMAAVTLVGSFVRNPWSEGRLSPLLVTGWRSPDGERVYLRTDTGGPQSVALVRPEDVAAGGFLTVFPFRESERGSPDRLKTVLRASDDSVMLLRLRPGTPVVLRAGQEDFHYGDLYAYSRICTHMGCPVPQFEDTTLLLECPCHQTQFAADQYCRPVFGPAARPLPQLPINVDETGYLYARGDFIEPIGPGFWERRPNA